jgi:predicted SAM-dependent methyltransferase
MDRRGEPGRNAFLPPHCIALAEAVRILLLAAYYARLGQCEDSVRRPAALLSQLRSPSGLMKSIWGSKTPVQFSTSSWARSGGNDDGPITLNQKVNLRSRIKKLPHHGIWRALNDLSRELGCLRRHRKAVHDARKYTNAKALKLNVGCGSELKTGWVNIDCSANADLQLDLREPIRLPNGSAQMIYSEHFLEHLNYPEDAKRFLSESFRVLEPGGTFSVGVPDAGAALLSYANARDRRQGEPNPWHPEWCQTVMEHINFLFRQGFEHRFAYDFETMEHALKEAGFVEIRQRGFDPDLDSKKWEFGTLYVNAMKPC